MYREVFKTIGRLLEMRKIFKSKKLLTFILTLVMVLSMSSFAFADILNVTVEFTQEHAGISGWPQGPITLAIDDTVYLKSYFTMVEATSPTINPLGDTTSVMDAILKAAHSIPKTVITGVDLDPQYGDPGAYISAIDDKVTWNEYWEFTDPVTGKLMAHSEGEGWTAYVTPDGGTETEPWEYLSRIKLEDGDAIRFDFSFYEYEWEK